MKFKWVIILLVVPVCAQLQNARSDSLIKLLPYLQDTGRIDCLNKISLAYYINALSETFVNVQTDSAILFASQALGQAKKINYTKGVAEALQNLGEIARDRGDLIGAEHYFRQSIPLFEKIQARESYSWANLTFGWSRHRQGKFKEAKVAYEQAMPYYVATGNKEKQSMLFRLISYTYSEQGYNEKAFENVSTAMRLTDDVQDDRGIISSPQNLALLYKDAGDTETAIAYFRLAAKNASSTNPVRYHDMLGRISLLNKQPDSAIYYFNQSTNFVIRITTDPTIRKKYASMTNRTIAEVFMMQNKYDSAIARFKQALPFFEKGNDRLGALRIRNLLARCYLEQQNFSTAFAYAKSLLESALESNARPNLRNAYELYWQIYDRQGKTDSAYKYNLKYSAIKDSILSDKYRRDIALSEMRSQDQQQKTKINLLQKDQQISREKLSLEQQKLKNESLFRYILIASAIALALFGVFIFRNIALKRKNEKQDLQHQLDLQQLETKKKTLEFQQQTTELEMQALRAQMNPHFIFNCLSSINRFILINKTEEASDYLTKFSRLIRMALHNSEKSLITLDNELEALRLYLDLERLRFKNAFDYSITFINAIDLNAVYIPPMLIQPFAENAIWHGLMHKTGMGRLEIELCAGAKTLSCIIADNGIGRKMSAALNSRSGKDNKSMGVEITSGRLALLNKSTNEPAIFNVEDLVDSEGNDCGTRISFKIPYKELTEVFD
jgi:hypothetical protein